MSEFTTKAQLYRTERESGMSYEEIGKKYGVSRQCVHRMCGHTGLPAYFRLITADGCVYPIWRKWMNDNKVSRSELLRRMGLLAIHENLRNLGAYMRGENNPRKEYIDRLIGATGLTYEKLFYREGE